MNMKLNIQEQREIVRCKRWRQEFQEFFQNKRKQMMFDYKIASIPSFEQVNQLFDYLNDQNEEKKQNKIFNFLANKPLVQDIMLRYFKSADQYCLNIFMICARTLPQAGYEDVFAYSLGLSDSHDPFHQIQGMKGLCKILHKQLPDETIKKLYNQDVVGNLFKILNQAVYQKEGVLRDYFIKKSIITLLKYLIHLNKFEKDFHLFSSKFIHLLEQILYLVYMVLKECLIFGPKNKSLPLILVIIRNQPCLCDTITKEVRQFLRSLLIDKNASEQTIIEVLKILITVSSSKNESMAYLFYEENILNILWNFIDHINYNIRDFIIHIYANYANSRHEGLKEELGQNSELLLRVIAEIKQQDEISQNIIYLIYGILVNCLSYVDDEILKQHNFLSLFPNKLMNMNYTQHETDQVILYIIITLLVNYNMEPTKEVKDYIKSFDTRKNIHEDVQECLDNLYKIIK